MERIKTNENGTSLSITPGVMARCDREKEFENFVQFLIKSHLAGHGEQSGDLFATEMIYHKDVSVWAITRNRRTCVMFPSPIAFTGEGYTRREVAWNVPTLSEPGPEASRRELCATIAATVLNSCNNDKLCIGEIINMLREHISLERGA